MTKIEILKALISGETIQIYSSFYRYIAPKHFRYENSKTALVRECRDGCCEDIVDLGDLWNDNLEHARII